MEKKLSRKVRRYVEAALELRVLKRQKLEYVELARHRGWIEAYNLALSRQDEALRALTGSQYAEAQRILAQGA